LKKNIPYEDIKDIPSWFVGHMLLPVRLKKENRSFTAEYSFFNKKIIFKNVFVPPDIPFETDGLYCIHFASIIAKINNEQFQNLKQHLEEIDLFKRYREEVIVIDYSEFQRFGNYQKTCRDRYLKYFGK
jgi:hypothetical protein